MIPPMEQKPDITAEEKWKLGGMDQSIRIAMLATINESSSFASMSWKKLPYILRTNLSNRKWKA